MYVHICCGIGHAHTHTYREVSNFSMGPPLIESEKWQNKNIFNLFWQRRWGKIKQKYWRKMKLERRIKGICQKIYNFNGFSGQRKMSKMKWNYLEKANKYSCRTTTKNLRRKLFVLSRTRGELEKIFNPNNFPTWPSWGIFLEFPGLFRVLVNCTKAKKKAHKLKGNNAERLAKSNHKMRCLKYVSEFSISLGAFWN